MPHVEILAFVEHRVVLPYKITAPAGAAELTKLQTAIDGGRSAVVNGWAFSNLLCRYKGFLARELRRSQFAVYRINESPRIFEGELVDTFVAEKINDILAFAKDFRLNQDTIGFETDVTQTQVAMSEIERQVWDDLQSVPQVSKKGKK